MVREFKSRRPHQKTFSDPRRFRWFVSQGSTAFEIFRRGYPPGETEPGESCNSGAQNGTVNRFSDRGLSVELSVNISRPQIACPDSGSKHDPGLFRYKRNNLRILILQRPKSGRIYHSLIPSQSRVSCREEQVQLEFLEW